MSEAGRALRQALILGALAVLAAAAVHFPLVVRFTRGRISGDVFPGRRIPGRPPDHSGGSGGPLADRSRGRHPGRPGREALQTRPCPGGPERPRSQGRADAARRPLGRCQGQDHRGLLRGRRLPVQPWPWPSASTTRASETSACWAEAGRSGRKPASRKRRRKSGEGRWSGIGPRFSPSGSSSAACSSMPAPSRSSSRSASPRISAIMTSSDHRSPSSPPSFCPGSILAGAFLIAGVWTRGASIR